MECYNCGRHITRERYCPGCSTDLAVYRRLVGISNYLYNRALGQISSRNMYGAIEDLKLSLGYNKTNTDARNLLGLCYYRIGEEVEAIKQWLISTVFQRTGNRADFYLDITRREPSENERINTYVRKYNQALGYAYDGSLDMAKIQLKKCVATNSNHVKAFQLIALLEIMTGVPDAAVRYLKKASAIDKNNPISAKYMHIAEQMIAEMDDRPTPSSTKYQSGNETIIQPKNRITSNVVSIVINVAVGIAIGAAVASFLIIPGIRKNAISEANATVDVANETISDKNQQIRTLEDENTTLSNELMEHKSEINKLEKSNQAESLLAQAYHLYYLGEVASTMDAINSVEYDLLSEDSKVSYTDMKAILSGRFMEETYAAGLAAYDSNNMDTAIKQLLRIVTADERYDTGNAMYMLAQAYRKQENMSEAIECYKRVVELFPNSSLATNANIYIEQFG